MNTQSNSNAIGVASHSAPLRTLETSYAEAVETIRKIKAANNSHDEDSVAIYCDKFLENAESSHGGKELRP